MMVNRVATDGWKMGLSSLQIRFCSAAWRKKFVIIFGKDSLYTGDEQVFVSIVPVAELSKS